MVLDTILDKNLLNKGEFRLSKSSDKPLSDKIIRAGIECRYGDMTKPETLAKAFEGGKVLFLVSYPSVGIERYEFHRNAIDAAKRAGVKHVIYTSLTFGGTTGEESIAMFMQAHVKTAEYLKASGLTWTIIREGLYSHLWNALAGFLRLDQNVDCDAVVPFDGPNSWASREDLGEATAEIISNWVSVDGSYYSLFKYIS